MPYMRRETGARLVRLMIFGMICLILVVAYVFWQSYDGRSQLINGQRAACERGKLDRIANARGWRIAESARRAEGQFEVANNYREIAESLEERSRIKCKVVFPDARFFP
jgi:hypothetical protein